MIVAIILWASVIWISPLMYFVLANETKFKKNIVVGVTLPYEAREDQQVKAALGEFKRRLKWTCIVLVVIAIPCFFIKGIGNLMVPWCIWIILCIVFPNIPYIICNSKLKKIKIEKGWKHSEKQSITIDTASIPSDRWLSSWLFVPSVILAALPLLWDRTMWLLYVTFAVTSLSFWFCYRYLYRNKSEMVDENAELSKVLTQVRRHNWGNMWLICAYGFAFISLGAFFTRNSPALIIIVIMIISLVVTVAAIRIEFNTRKVQEKLTADSGKSWYVDDDDKWLGGIIYYNPNDDRLIINSRVGTNSSINLAKTSGKIIMGFAMLLLLALPFMGPYINSIEASPIGLKLRENSIVSTRGRSEYSVPYDNIKDAQLLEKLPVNMTRTFGTGMDNLLRGNFTSSEIGSIKVCLDPNYTPFILITTEDGEHYLFGSRDSELTRQVYKQLESDYLKK